MTMQPKAPNSPKWVNRIFAGDKVMWVVIILLLVYSLFLVYSNTAYEGKDNATQELVQQLLFICIGMTGFYFMQMCGLNFYRKISAPLYVLSLVLTVLMIALHKGSGAARALTLGGFSFQPFELLKFAVVMNLASQLASRQKIMDKLEIIPSFHPSEWRRNQAKQLEILTSQTIPLLLPIAIGCIITVRFSNSTTLIIGGSCLAMMYLSRIKAKDLGKIAFVGIVVAVSAIAIYGAINTHANRADTLKSRVGAWSPWVAVKSVEVESDGKEYYKRRTDENGDPIEHDQTLYAKMSIATGGLKGKGPGQSTNRYLAEADKDMAYAFLIEEHGLLGGGLVMLFAFLLMFYRSIEIFRKCSTTFPGLLVLGIGTVIVLQAFLHMLVSVSLFPLTGQQLPIVSKGGSSLVLTLTMLGILMGVSAKVEQQEAERVAKLNTPADRIKTIGK